MYQTLTYIRKKTSVWPQPLELPRKESFKRPVFLLILFFFIARVILASVVELGNDEAYYWFYTQYLQWNYFDHPPMVALMGRLFTLDRALEHQEVFVRSGSMVCCAFSTWFLFKATSLLHSERAGWYAAVLYNTSFYAGIVAGFLIMPDSPQMFFWTLSMWMLARILADDRPLVNWILFGLAAGLCIMSKVHGVFIWLGLGAFALFKNREWLKRPHLYTALAITFAIASPLLVWNIQNDYATYRFHSQRVNIIGWGIDLKNFLHEFSGQIFFNNPVNVALLVAAFAAGIKKSKTRAPAVFILSCTGLSLAFILLFVSLFRPVFPHWSGPAYVSLLPLAAIYLTEAKRAVLYPQWLRWSLGAFLVFLTGWPLLIHFYPGTWGTKNNPDYGRGDITLDRYGWQDAGKEFVRFYRDEVNKRSAAPNTPVVCNTWWGAHIEYYFCRPSQITMIGLGSTEQIHHYLWTNSRKKEKVNFGTAFCIVPSDEYYDAQKHYAGYYHHIRLVRTIETTRNGKEARCFYVYRLSGWKNNLPYRY